MRASNHKGRTHSDGNSYDVRHNDRSFDSKTDKHIDTTKSADNIYLVIDENGGISEKEKDTTFRAYEKERYAELFGAYLIRKAEKANAQRHPERIKTIDQYLDGKRTCPEEEILQIGKEGEYQDIEKFRQAVELYIQKHQEKYPDIKILDAAIHTDETSLHCHLRKVYTAPDKEGNLEAKQNECLKNLGFTLPDPEKEKGQFNNLKIPYTEESRALWLDVCEEIDRGLKLEREPAPEHHSLPIAEYKRQQELEELAIAKAQKTAISEEIDDLEGVRAFKSAQVGSLDETIKANQSTIESQKAEIGVNNSVLEGLKKMIEELTEQIEALKQRLKELFNRKTIADREVQAHEISVQQTRQQIDALEQTRDTLQDAVQKMQADADRVKTSDIEVGKTITGKLAISEKDLQTLKSKAKLYDTHKDTIKHIKAVERQAEQKLHDAEKAAKKGADAGFDAFLSAAAVGAHSSSDLQTAQKSLDVAERFISSLGKSAEYKAFAEQSLAERRVAKVYREAESRD